MKTNFDTTDKTALTGEALEAAKNKYGRVFYIKVTNALGDIDAQCWLRKPTRQILDLAMASSVKKSSMFNEVIIKNCWLAGDKSIIEDDENFMAASAEVSGIIAFKEAELTEL